MAVTSKRVYTTIASQLEIMSQDLAEYSAVMARFSDALDVVAVETALATKGRGVSAVKTACDEAMADLARLSRR